MKMNQDNKHTYDLCKNHVHSYVLAEMNDSSRVDGIITGLDDEYVYMAIPIDNEQLAASPQEYSERQFGFGYPGFGYGGFYYPRPRFRRLVLPLAALAAISLLPWY